MEHGGLKTAFVLCKCRKQQSCDPHSVITALHIKKQLVPVYDEEVKKKKADYSIIELPHSLLIIRMTDYELHRKVR